MKISDLMSRNVQIARPDESLQSVSARMAAGDFGFMPVVDGDQLIGTITDRDMAIRGIATGASASAPVLQFISRDPQTVREDDDAKSVLEAMGSKQIRRLPVVDNDGRIAGVVSLGDLSIRVKEKYAGEALEEISRQ